MAATTPKGTTFTSVKAQIKSGNLAPIYLLRGEEGYYIDALVDMIVESVPEADRDFNLTVLYAPETDMDTVIDRCHGYSMMGGRMVVIVKECQAVPAQRLDKLKNYLARPVDTTTLVICCRGDKDKGRGLDKPVLSAGGVVFESVKLKNPERVIEEFVREKGLNIEPKGLSMLSDFVGSDLSRLYNEIDKLTVALPAGSMVTPEVIERHIGVSKDFNTYELVSALATRNGALAFRIVDYFRSNPKGGSGSGSNAVQAVIPTIWNLFSSLLVMLYAKDKSDAGLCAALGRKGNWLPQEYKAGLRNYNAWQLLDIIHELCRADCASKGVGSRMDGYDILQGLVYRILTTSGR